MGCFSTMQTNATDAPPFSGSLEAGVSRLLIEADVAASCLVIDQEIPPIDYDLMLYCAPEASPKAQRLWQEIDRGRVVP